MSRYIYINIILIFLYQSLIYADTLVPTADAGANISELVTSCTDKNIIIAVDGSGSGFPAGVCESCDGSLGNMSIEDCCSENGGSWDEVNSVCDNSCQGLGGSWSSATDTGVCDTGVCSESTMSCTTFDGEVTSETCDSFSDCDEIKVCIGGDNANADCTGDMSGTCENCEGFLLGNMSLEDCCSENGGNWDEVNRVCDDSCQGLGGSWITNVCGEDGICQFPGECLAKYSYEAHCEAAGETWEPNYEYITKNECEDLHGVSNNYWYDFSLEFEWSSDSEDLTVSDSSSVNTDIIFNPLSSSDVQQYEIYLTVKNEFKEFDENESLPSDKDTLLIDLDPQLPCAVAGDDIYICRACGEGFALYDSTYAADVLSDIQIDASSSYSNAGSNFSYSWVTPDGFTLSDATIFDPNITVDYTIAKNAVNVFTLEVTDNNSNLVSELDTLVFYMNPSRPEPPQVEVYPENDRVTLNWERNASINSIDSLTGYTDFEGYKVYKSIDGGETWGSADDRIIINGEFKGWRNEEQSDLTENQDFYFCIKGVNTDFVGDDVQFSSWDECVDVLETNAHLCCADYLIRGSSVSSLDPYAPWINLGNDSGLKFSYIDNNVYNGKEYTYAVVAYDMGLQTYTNEVSETDSGICITCEGLELSLNEEDCCELNGGAWIGGDDCQDSCSGDGHTWDPVYEYIETWADTNPDHFTYDGINGFYSLESHLVDSVNVVTAIPSFYAENVDNISDFIDVDPDFGVPAENKVMYQFDNTVGNGGIFFQIINPYSITDNLYEFQVSADYGSDEEIFEGYKTENPRLYVWQIDQDSLPLKPFDYSITSQDDLDHDSKCELLNLPGSYIEGICSRSSQICSGGTKDGRDCTYKDEDYCSGGGECIDSEINFLDDYYSCVCDDIMADLSGASGSLDGLAESYNDWLDGGDTIFYPFYEIEDFPIKYLYQNGYDENYTDFLDGLKFIFNNNVETIEDLEYYNSGEVAVKTLQSYDKDSLKTDLVTRAGGIEVQLEYGNGGSVFDNKPSYSYRLELSDTPQYEAVATTPSSGCSDRPKTLLPFRVINTITEKVVGVNHVDKGGQYDDAAQDIVDDTCVQDGNPCSQDEYCDVNECVELKGYGDCTWGKNERTSFTKDTVHVGLTTNYTSEYTFDLKMNYSVYSLWSKGIDPSTVNPWSLGQLYNTDDVVKYNDMFWQASEQTDNSPIEWIDNDDDGINENAWNPIYPWNDGDYIIIEPTRWYVHGDRWIADLSKLGQDSEITEESLSKVSVVPNPYIVYSDYDETATSRRLWFNHLPNKCRITIYTVSGERVASILHDEDNLSGKESWDLRSQSGDPVAPGLYIYTVESEGKNRKYLKHISKFAIIK